MLTYLETNVDRLGSLILDLSMTSLLLLSVLVRVYTRNKGAIWYLGVI